MRCFVAIPLPADTRETLLSACNAVRAVDRNWRGEKWVAPENLHITVAFLGEVPAQQIDILAEKIGREFTHMRKFDLPFARLHAAPDARRARMLWASYDDPEGMGAVLATAVGDAVAPLAIALEERAFWAHVTLVRARRPRPLSEHASEVLTRAARDVPAFVSVPSATLLSSTLTKAGPRYEPLCTWRFSA
jgi:2'-5' RNA ligase